MLLDAMTVSRMISCLYFLMSSLAFFLIILDIYVYSIRCLLSPIPAILRRFATRAVFVMIIIDFCGLLIALATIDALCWIMSVMVSLMVSMSSGSCSVSNRLLNSSWNSIFFYLIHKNKVKASFYIAQYPVFRTVQSALHFIPLTDLFTQTPSRLLWEASNHMLQLMREGCSYT